jgi:hypothetical protein
VKTAAPQTYPVVKVDGVAGHRVEAFLQSLAEGGVGMPVTGQFGGGQYRTRDVRKPQLACTAAHYSPG